LQQKEERKSTGMKDIKKEKERKKRKGKFKSSFQDF